MNYYPPTPRWPVRMPPPVQPGEAPARAFWQSRHKLRNPPELTDLRALARSLGETK